MKKRVIKVKLSEKGIDEAIKELEDWYEWLQEKAQEFVYELAAIGVEIAKVNFGKAIYDGTNDVGVRWDDTDEYKATVIANGNSVFFIEFGTGIKYPDDHPEKSADLVNHGQYGKGKGADPDGWDYIGDYMNKGGEFKHSVRGTSLFVFHTYGNPANMSMYLTREELKRKFEEVARKVFK